MSAAFRFKTLSEQRVKHLEGVSRKRPLTDAESADLHRALHSIYCQNAKAAKLAQVRAEELLLLEKLRAEAAMPERYPRG